MLNEKRYVGLPAKIKFVRHNWWSPGARFSKAREIFRARKGIFSSPVSKNGEVYASETSCMKRNSVHLKNMWIKQLCNRKVRDFAMAFQVQKISGVFEKRAPGPSENCFVERLPWGVLWSARHYARKQSRGRHHLIRQLLFVIYYYN